MVAGTAHADWLTDLTSPFEAALAEGSWGPVLGIMFAAGLLTSLTPCVYPMIAITVSIFGASQAKSKLHGAGLSTMYVLGMCALFTPLGLIVGLTGGVFGDFLGNPWIVIPLAVFFVVMATSMFGAFELSLPPSLQNKLAQMGGLGPKGAFTLGLVGGLIAAPCTGPVLGGLLAWITTTQNAALGGAALFAYSVGLGLPTWLVGTFAISLPKSGRWLEWVKSVFGIVMVAAALWFLRAFIPVGSGTVSDYIQRTPTWLMIAAGSGTVAGALSVTAGVTLAAHLTNGRGNFGHAFLGQMIGGAVAVPFVVLALDQDALPAALVAAGLLPLAGAVLGYEVGHANGGGSLPVMVGVAPLPDGALASVRGAL